MPQPTPVEVIDAVQVFIAEYLERPPEELIYHYDPGMRCEDATPGVNDFDQEVWTIRVRNAFPEDDGLRISIAEFLYDKFGIGAEVVLEWR